MNFKDKVKELIDSVLSENPTLFLIDLSISNDNAVRIVIDGDQGVGIDDCIAISRAVEHNLDREEVDFSIEVTSFGATEPFQLERQYRKNIGRNVEVKTTDGKKHEGLLKNVEGGNITLETETREPKPVGKGKITMKKEHLFALNDIKETKVIIKF
ncbi:ribosome assembly cofactor RimP [Capnocytophaga cynodegmi]|uniref:Ribosome maturation factor RimP n=1 Tax=Capnocytophaga cynodegmi TaxID=28189 RepID=A0A0B7H5W4_9FLAO|nr:ribosome assembly cofactor RimP [Capnocytophaga cynodegmi]CEN35016.1 Ribosome maturation factor RimP [Capnocytophaga cynodegmi]